MALEKKMVRNMRMLRALQKAKLIVLHEQTGETVSWYGQKGKAWYIDDCVGSSSFEFNDYKFTVEYRSGSFFPYVYVYIDFEYEISLMKSR